MGRCGGLLAASWCSPRCRGRPGRSRRRGGPGGRVVVLFVVVVISVIVAVVLFITVC